MAKAAQAKIFAENFMMPKVRTSNETRILVEYAFIRILNGGGMHRTYSFILASVIFLLGVNYLKSMDTVYLARSHWK